MSYTRTYTKRIAVQYSGHVSYTYPATQHGGSGSAYYSGTAYEDVQVNINVDTDPFDHSVQTCADHVDALTGTVVATEAAQVASIKQKAKQIGTTVVDGFFNTVRFEISTQIVELTKKVEARLMDLHEKQKKLMALRDQMEKDYHRTADRYARIFEDLNKELDNRVHALDQPVFSSADQMYSAEDRFMDTDILNVVALSGKENAILDAQLGTAIAKNHASKALAEASIFLSKKKATEMTLAKCTIDELDERTFYAPVCYFYATDERNVVESRAYSGDFLPAQVSGVVTQQLVMDKLPQLSDTDKERIDLYFKNLLNEQDAQDEHAMRVKKNISNLYSL